MKKTIWVSCWIASFSVSSLIAIPSFAGGDGGTGKLRYRPAAEAPAPVGYGGLTKAQQVDVVEVLGDLTETSGNYMRLALDTSNEAMFNLRDIAVAGVTAAGEEALEETGEAALEYGGAMITPGVGTAFGVLNEAKGYVEPAQYIVDKDYWELAEWTAKQTFIVPIKTIGALMGGAAGSSVGLHGTVKGAEIGWDVGGVVAAGVEGAADELGEQIGTAIAGE